MVLGTVELTFVHFHNLTFTALLEVSTGLELLDGLVNDSLPDVPVLAPGVMGHSGFGVQGGHTLVLNPPNSGVDELANIKPFQVGAIQQVDGVSAT